ncbi:MAG TPA: hypothetical protein VFE13_12905 [Caulobacteraceae bacterium]|nr:hypothetical protein [Caulobacteraceae bacterium]
MLRRLAFLCLAAWLSLPAVASADAAPFDLQGPILEVNVTHAGAALPISEVPNLAVGDQLLVKADLPAGQSVHYLLVAAFLRGATNPPPTSWFHRAETWHHAKGGDVLKAVVPEGAQQVIVFLAPQTGGDFDTLVGAVRGRPGAFVRASLDLNQAALDRSRLDAYLAAIRGADHGDPERLRAMTPLLARSLAIKLNTDCFQRMADLQAACLMQGQDALVLNDGHSASIVQALTSGVSADLAFQLSATPHADFGLYSPYVAAVMDIARILDSFRTAKFAYIPALSTASGDKLALLLNTPPSFHDQLSVLVTALPSIEPVQAPPLQPVDPKAVYCADRPGLVLPVEGAPLAYSTAFAHDMSLRLKSKSGAPVELPARADPEAGGYVVDTRGFEAAKFEDQTEATLHGAWGFSPFEGPTFQLQSSHPEAWRVAEGDEQALVVGRDDTLRLEGRQASCVKSVTLRESGQGLAWNAEATDRLSIVVPLAGASPGPVTLLVKQYGMAQPQTVALKSYAEAGRLQSFTLHAGATSGVLQGARLDEVTGLTLAGVAFKPGALVSVRGGDELTLDMTDPGAVSKLAAGQTAVAKVALADGRTVSLKVAITGPSPSATLIGKGVAPAAAEPAIAVRLTSPDELRQGAVLSFSLRARQPSRFTGREAIEVATTGGASVKLTSQNGLILVDPQVAVATLDTAKAFDGSAFGPLRYRLVTEDGAGDWQPLGTLVRAPTLKALKCEQGAEHPCQLEGAKLFLIDAIAADPGFAHAVKVPIGFPGYSLAAPHPVGGKLYLRLHDDPSAVNEVDFNVRKSG